jgi:outer membrane protein TolC
MKKGICTFLLFVSLNPSVIRPGEKKEFTLPEILSIGLENNPSILAKKKEIEAAEAAYQAAKKWSNPEFEFRMGRARSYDSHTERATQSFSISQSIENPFKRNYRIQFYEKDRQAVEYNHEFLELELGFEIKSLYYQILYLKKEEELARKNLDSIKAIHQLIEKRAKLGEVKELEAIKLYVEALKAQREWHRVQTHLKLAKDNLNKLVGEFLPADYSLRGQLAYTPLVVDEETMLNRALLSHPLIKEKEAEVEQSKANLSLRKWKRFPDFKLSGFSHEELDGRSQGVGISLDIPLWNFRSKEIAEAENIYLKKMQELKALRMELSTSVRANFSQLRLSERTLKIYHEGLLKQAEQSLKISEVSYKQGEISLVDYLDSQRTYNSILKDYQQSLYSWNVDRAVLEKAIGEELE